MLSEKEIFGEVERNYENDIKTGKNSRGKSEKT